MRTQRTFRDQELALREKGIPGSSLPPSAKLQWGLSAPRWRSFPRLSPQQLLPKGWEDFGQTRGKDDTGNQ